MKKTSALICAYLWTIFLCLSINAQDFKTVQDGIEYAELTREIDKTPVKMNLLRLDLTKVRLDVVHAMDAAIGTETVSSMAKRHGAIAAINAGFFRLDKSIFAGDAAGVLMIDGKLLSESRNDRTALLISNDSDLTRVAIHKLKSEILPETKKGYVTAVTGINRERGEEDFIIYTPSFHRTTLTNDKGIEVIIRKNKIVQIYREKGSNLIPPDGYVISLSGKYVKDFNLKTGAKFKYDEGGLFSRVTNEKNPDDKFFNEDITNGVPQLIKDGKINITWEQEKESREFVETKHPRTAVAKLKDGKFLMITVDGRSESSGGIGLEDLAKLLLEFGATDAMNLDGGGSTTMFLGGKVVNRPSDKEGERKVGDAILVFPRKK